MILVCAILMANLESGGYESSDRGMFYVINGILCDEIVHNLLAQPFEKIDVVS